MRINVYFLNGKKLTSTPASSAHAYEYWRLLHTHLRLPIRIDVYFLFRWESPSISASSAPACQRRKAPPPRSRCSSCCWWRRWPPRRASGQCPPGTSLLYPPCFTIFKFTQPIQVLKSRPPPAIPVTILIWILLYFLRYPFSLQCTFWEDLLRKSLQNLIFIQL